MVRMIMNYSRDTLKYLKQLRRQYPTARQASAEIIRLRAVLKLPKGTEHFLSDLHGESAAFLHMLRNASGVIKQKTNDLYRDILPTHERDMLCTLVYYPEEKLSLLKKQGAVNAEWYRITILRLVELARLMAVKYTRTHVRAAMPEDLGELMEELLLREDVHDKQAYYSETVDAIIECGQADAVIIELSRVIQYLSIDHLHIIGDIYDRGPHADLIMDALDNYHDVDVQWGNHASSGWAWQPVPGACIAQVLVTHSSTATSTRWKWDMAYRCARWPRLPPARMRPIPAPSSCPSAWAAPTPARTTWSWPACTRPWR